MKHIVLALGAPVLLGLAAGNAHAALLGVTQTFPDVSLTASPYLIYDHNGVNGTTGRLTVVTGAVQLAEGAAAGGNTATQSYFATGDTVPDVVFNIDVNNTTGAFLGGTVTIGFGNATGAARWSWQGAITNFGSIGAPGSGTIFDATWTMSADQYQNMPATLAQFVNGYLTGAAGGLKINSSATWGSTANFGNDWIYGATPNSPTLNAYTAALNTPILTTSTLIVDVFATPVPLPAAAWLLLAGLGLLAPVVRAHAAPLGVTPKEPTIDFGGAGIIDYNATTGVVTISGVPSTLFRSDPFLFGQILGATGDDESLITVQFKIDAAGHFVSGVDGPDLTVTGSVDVDFDSVPDYDGVLLTAEVTQFGFEDGVSGGDDVFDLRLNAVGGLLASFYTSQDLALRIVSEASTEFPDAFGGSFDTDFVGQAKGVLGATDVLTPPLCSMHVDAYCSVNGSPNKSKCRIQVSKSPKHWDWEDRSCHGRNYRRYTYGMHGDPIPSWASRYHSTDVKFTYVLKNTGTTPVSDIVVDDSFDTPVAGIPASLAPGARVTLTRTEKLHEPLDDIVIVSGVYQTAQCGDRDTVVIKDKLRDRRRHDYDRFRDKGERDNNPYR